MFEWLFIYLFILSQVCSADCPLVDKLFNVNTLTMVKTFSPVSLFLNIYKPLQMQILTYWQIVNIGLFIVLPVSFFIAYSADFVEDTLQPTSTPLI